MWPAQIDRAAPRDPDTGEDDSDRGPFGSGTVPTGGKQMRFRQKNGERRNGSHAEDDHPHYRVHGRRERGDDGEGIS